MIKIGAKTGFTVLLTAFTAVIFFLTLNLSRIAGVVPFWVVVPTLVLLVILLITDVWNKPGSSLVEPHGDIQRAHANLDEETSQEKKPFSSGSVSGPLVTWRVLLWILWMITSVYLFGLLYAIPLYICVYLKWRAEESWLIAITMALAMWALLCIFFIGMLQKNLSEGKLLVWLGF